MLLQPIRFRLPFSWHGAAGLFPNLAARLIARTGFHFWNKRTVCVFPSIVAGEPAKMLTMMATVAAPVVVLTTLIIVICEIRDAWHRNRIE